MCCATLVLAAGCTGTAEDRAPAVAQADTVGFTCLNAQLKRAEDRLAVVLASIRDGFLGVDKDLVVNRDQPAGRAPARVPGRTTWSVTSCWTRSPRCASSRTTSITHAPAESELLLRGVGSVVRIQRGQEGGYLMFLRRLGVATPGPPR